MFWCLYWIDRELVFPAVCDADVPAWMVHCTHTNILFVVASEALLQSRSGPLDGKLETKMNACCAVLYAAMYYTIFLTTGDWLYPVFGIFTWWQICMFQGLVWLSIDLFYRLQFPVYRLIHGSVNNKEKVANGLQKTLFNIKDAINSEPKNKTCDIINAEDRSRPLERFSIYDFIYLQVVIRSLFMCEHAQPSCRDVLTCENHFKRQIDRPNEKTRDADKLPEDVGRRWASPVPAPLCPLAFSAHGIVSYMRGESSSYTIDWRSRFSSCQKANRTDVPWHNSTSIVASLHGLNLPFAPTSISSQ
ncbi:Androgen-dependent TFPI-regulating protein [Eumeta japonica]|uniref:Androgen-dependent TFPI-regulating protein n=1 Tax=Eumeta variegata TaxID=151549 RepID=A0A4C1XNU5_EUMVA|nr:Androgen-dependent TFPI-regulating protein [Eumeta japonica]